MTGDVPAAALRLLALLPVRTHTQPRPPERGETMRRFGRRKAAPKVITGRGRGGLNCRVVWVGKLRFDSVRACYAHFRIGRHTFTQWRKEGKARYE
jgi:hypothetical protein